MIKNGIMDICAKKEIELHLRRSPRSTRPVSLIVVKLQTATNRPHLIRRPNGSTWLIDIFLLFCFATLLVSSLTSHGSKGLKFAIHTLQNTMLVSYLHK